jgi:hypothetical protein
VISASAARVLRDEVCHAHGVDLDKLEREWSLRRGIELEQAAGNPFGPFHQRFVLDQAPEKVQKILQRMKRQREAGIDLRCGRQGFASADFMDFPSASLSTINTTTTETNLWNPSISAPLPVGEIRGGKSWYTFFGGVAGTTGTPAISFRARCGTNNSAPPTGTDLGVGPTMTLGTFTAQPFYGQGFYGCRSVGIAASTAAFAASGFVILAGAAAATTVGTCVFGGALPTTIDQTAAQGISVSVIWGTSSASNTITTQYMMFGSLN